MSTALRPIIGSAEGRPLFTEEKKFFIHHWLENLNQKGA